MTVLEGILADFEPPEWAEETYVRAPPFVIESLSGKVLVVPRDRDAEMKLSRLSPLLGLRKKRQGRTRYYVTRGSSVAALRQFDWFVRRSWRNQDLTVLWALVYIGERSGWSQSEISLEAVADVAGIDPRACGEALVRLFHDRFEDGKVQGLRDYAADRRLVRSAVEKVVRQLPTWTEEVVMGVLCSSPGGSVADIYEGVLAQGLSVGAVYKVSEALKGEGFIRPARLFRVNERGPMRELLSADCRNCFYGFAGPDSCLRDTIKQLGFALERNCDKKPTHAETSALFASMKPAPYSSRTNRRVLETLRLEDELARMTRERRVSVALKKIEDYYQVELPLKIAQAPPRGAGSAGRAN